MISHGNDTINELPKRINDLHSINGILKGSSSWIND